MTTALVTGATDGIGLHTARKLAASGTLKSVLIHGRDESRLERARREIEGVSRGVDVQGFRADFADLSQVKDMCRAVTDRCSDSGLTVLIQNAGVYSDEYVRTKDGFELTYQTNVLAPHIITSLLHPIVKTKIIHVASISASSSVDLDVDRADTSSSAHSGHRAYSESKLLNVMQACAYAKGLENLIVQSLDPGTVNTKMLLAGWGACGIRVGEADNEFSLATRLGETGGYFVNDRPSRYPSSMCTDEASLAKLLDMLAKDTGVHFLHERLRARQE